MATKVKKIVGRLLAALLAAIIALLCIILFWLGPTVKLVAEHLAPMVLGTPLTIDKLKIDPLHGTFLMTGFALANYGDFGHTNTASLANMEIAIDMGSIFSPTVTVHRVQIDSPHFVYEHNETIDNITEYIRNIDEYLGTDPTKPKKEKPEKEADKHKTSKPKVVIAEQLEINDVRLDLANTVDPNEDINFGFDQLAVSMTNGMVHLKNLHVSNPGRLETPDLFTLDSINIELDPDSIYSDTVSIRDVQVIRPYAYLEQNPQTDTVAEFMRIAESLSSMPSAKPKKGENSAQPTIKPAKPTDAPPPIELHNLLVDDIQLKLLDTTQTNAPMEPRMLAGIGAVSVKLVDGQIQIRGISIPNVQGYISSNLFQLASIDVSIDPDSIFSEQADIRRVFVDSPEIHLEQTETSSNVADLQTQMMGFVPPEGAVKGAPTPEAAPQSVARPEPIPLDQQPVVLRSLIVTNFAITLSQPVPTNQPSGWSLSTSDLAKLNPLSKVSLDKLNPLDKLEKLNPLAKGEPEEEPTEGGPVKLVYFKRLSLQPLDGLLEVDKLGVANPPGFANRNLVQLDGFTLDIDPDTLQSDVLLIRDIVIDRPRIAYERRITTDNLKALQEEIEKAVSKNEESPRHEKPAEASKEPAEEDASGQKVIIEHLLVKDALTKAKLSVAPAIPIPLPDIEMHDIGKDKGGTTFLGAVGEIGTTIYDTIIGAVSGATGFAGDALKGLGGLTLGTVGLKNEETPSPRNETKVQPSEPDTSKAKESGRKRKPLRPFFHHPGRMF